MYKVYIIDDDKSLKSTIESKIDCSIDMKGLIGGNGNYDLIIVNGSFDDKEYDSVYSMEKYLLENPEVRDKVLLLIDNKYLEYVSPESIIMCPEIEKSKKITFKVQGDKEGTKVDNIINIIKSHAKSNGIDIEDKLPEGTLSDEIQKLLNELNSNYNSIISDLSKTGVVLDRLREIKPSVDSERQLKHLVSSSTIDVCQSMRKFCDDIEKTESFFSMNSKDDNDFSLSRKK